MIVLRDPALVQDVQEPEIRKLLAQRFEDICQGEAYEADIHGFFLLVEPGDSVSEIETEAGVPILRGLFNDARYGDPSFRPCFEVLEEHAMCFEIVFVPSGDFGVVIFVSKESGIDNELLRFCREYAVPAPGLTAFG